MSDRSPACRIARVFPESALAARHAARCPGCRAFASAGSGLDQLLRSQAAENPPPPPTSLERRIVAAVRMSSAGHADSHWRTIFAGSFGALAVVALAFLMFRPAAPVITGPTDSAIFKVEDLRGTAQSLSARVWNSMISAGDLVDSRSLGGEWGLVYSNARVALRFLEKNFVPDSFRGTVNSATPRNG